MRLNPQHVLLPLVVRCGDSPAVACFRGARNPAASTDYYGFGEDRGGFGPLFYKNRVVDPAMVS